MAEFWKLTGLNTYPTTKLIFYIFNIYIVIQSSLHKVDTMCARIAKVSKL